MDSLGRVKEWRGGEGRGDRGNGGGEGFLPRKTQYTLNPNPVNRPKDQIVQDMAQIGDPPGGTKSIGVQGR